ncbi:MAG: hypothetical protein ACTSUI_02735, partial [Promethearchaeota archaeon]
QYKFTRLSLYSQIGVYIFGIIGPIFNLLSVILYMNMNSGILIFISILSYIFLFLTICCSALFFFYLGRVFPENLALRKIWIYALIFNLTTFIASFIFQIIASSSPNISPFIISLGISFLNSTLVLIFGILFYKAIKSLYYPQLQDKMNLMSKSTLLGWVIPQSIGFIVSFLSLIVGLTSSSIFNSTFWDVIVWIIILSTILVRGAGQFKFFKAYMSIYEIPPQEPRLDGNVSTDPTYS